ncbi:MAG: right-handed parallel beta-helix repeat-containing protein [Candidatus Eisenbacteria bacterium]
MKVPQLPPCHDVTKRLPCGPLAVVLAAAFALCTGSAALAEDSPIESVGPGVGFLQSGGDPSAGTTFLFHADETYENGYAWRYGGITEPYYSAFAERFEGSTIVNTAVFDFTQVGNQLDQTMDVYVWDDDGGIPGAVLCVVTDIIPDFISWWPEVSRHTVDLPACATGPVWWTGFWGNWPLAASGWFIAADLDGPGGGAPYTNITPGIGYPTGWNNVSVVWGPTQALGIGAFVESDPPPTTLQAMIAAANSGETVIVPPGVYAGPGNKRLDFLGKDIVFRSASGPASTIIDCEGDGRAFRFHTGESTDAVLDGFTIRNGAEPSESGGAILVTEGSTPTLMNLVIENCSAVTGGALAVEDTSVLLADSRLVSNTASANGGGSIAATNSTVVLEDVIQRSGTRGAVYAVGSDVTIRGGEIKGHSTNLGGAAVRATSGSTVSLDFVVVSGNLAVRGGGLLIDNSSTVSVTRSTFGSNHATGNGGAISCSGELTVDRSIVWSNCADGAGDEIELTTGSATVTCSAVDPAGLAGPVTFVGDQVTDDPMLCGPISCDSAPTLGGNLHLQEDSPGLPVNSPCGHLLGPLWIRCPVPVIPEGACCLATSECFLTVDELCTPFGGFYAGNGSTCEPGNCDPADAPEFSTETQGALRLELTGPNPTSGTVRFAIETVGPRTISVDLRHGRSPSRLDLPGRDGGSSGTDLERTGRARPRAGERGVLPRVRSGEDETARPIVIAN